MITPVQEAGRAVEDMAELLELAVSEDDADTLEAVSIELLPGKSAVVAAADEAWMAPLDSKMEAAGGTVFVPLNDPRVWLPPRSVRASAKV